MRRLRRPLIGAVLGLLAGLLSLFFSKTSIGLGAEDLTYDWRLRATARPADARRDVVLVLINESSLRAFEPMFGAWPWPRVLHAGAVDFLARAGARVIAYDVLFLEHDRRTSFEVAGNQMSGADSDAALVDAVKRAGNVVLLADAVYEGEEAGEQASGQAGTGASGQAGELGFPVRPTLREPFEELSSAALAIGHNFAVKETGGAVRAMAPFIEWHGSAIPSLGLAAALAADRLPLAETRLEGNTLRLGSKRMPLLPSREALLNFHGPYQLPGGAFTYEAYPFFNVLLSEDQIARGETPAVDPSVFKDKLVFVGTSADGLGDIWKSPFAGVMPGVQLHAALADDVRSGRFMRRAGAREDAALTLAAGLAAGLIATVLPVIWGGPLILCVAAGLGAWLTRQTETGLWLAAVAPFAAMALAAFEGVAWQYFVEGRAKRRVTKLFGRYVSKDVFEHLMADPSVARLGGERRDMTVLFSDIRGFTTASERGKPEAVVEQLNEYFTAMVDVLFRHHGTLDKFVGDMVMGLFGAPVADPRHADHAVASALEMIAVLDRLNAGWAAAGRPTLDIGIGINSGDMIAGNIGSDTIMSYTVIGDAVNLGARLESLNKEYGTRILISEETRRRLTGPVRTKLIGEVTVKGRSRPVTVHQVTTEPS